MRKSPLKRSGMARVNEGSHSCTCHPHAHTQVEWAIGYLPFSQPHIIIARWLVLFSRPAEGRRLSWAWRGWVGRPWQWTWGSDHHLTGERGRLKTSSPSFHTLTLVPDGRITPALKWNCCVISVMNVDVCWLTRTVVVGERPGRSTCRRWSSRTGPYTGEREVWSSTLHSPSHAQCLFQACSFTGEFPKTRIFPDSRSGCNLEMFAVQPVVSPGSVGGDCTHNYMRIICPT